MAGIPMDVTFPLPDGTIAKQGEGESEKPVTARDALIIAATNELPEDTQASPNLISDKFKRYNIWQKLAKEEQKVVHFTAEEAAHMKQRVARIFAVVIAGPLMLLLDGQHECQQPQKSISLVDNSKA